MVNRVELFSQFQLVVGIFTTGIAVALVAYRWPAVSNWFSHGLSFAGCILIANLALNVLAQGKPEYYTVGYWLQTSLMMFRIDALAAFFLLLLGGVGAAVSLYAIGYTSGHSRHGYALLPALFNFFILSMFLVLTASHVGIFLIAWEIMTLVSLLLILFEHENPDNVRAGFVYVLMTHIGTAFVIAAFFILASAANSLSFKLLDGSALPEATRTIVFLFALIGFGTKAGIIPLHVWLPKAHPAAPSHVSAMLSGVMLKTAIYGMCRFYLEFLGTGPLWWGVLVMGCGVLSALLGVLYAFMENDIKRLLAYSSLENMGVILLGLGAGMVYMAKGHALLAGLAWVAALYHVFNHAIFKSLLFMGAGVVVKATGTRDMESLGGLIHTMPYTALFFLAGSAAISALPPFNGFTSEWLTLQSLFFLPEALPGVAGKICGGLLFVALGMTASLVAGCFVKAFGIIFLARPRSKKAEKVREAGFLSLAPMAVLAATCLGIGVWPEFLLRIISQALRPFAGINTDGMFRQEWGGVVFRADPAFGILSVSTVMILTAVGVFAAAALFFLRGRPKLDVQGIWACGIVPNARNQYSSMGFSKPVRWAFRFVLRSQRERVVEENDNLYSGRKLAYHQTIHYVFDEVLYHPIQRWILREAKYIKRLQAGSVQLYVGYVLIVTVVVLIWSSRG